MELSRESRALRKSYADFNRGADPDAVITMFYSKFLLTPEEKERATQSTLTARKQLDVLFECLERRVSADSSVFNKLVQVLLEEPALAAVGKNMRGERKGCCSYMFSLPHRPVRLSWAFVGPLYGANTCKDTCSCLYDQRSKIT